MSALLNEASWPMFEFSGMYFPSVFVTEKNLSSILKMELKEGDIFLTSFIRSGSMWTQATIWSIMNSGKPLPDRLQIEFPHLELLDCNFLENMPSPRTFKTHLPTRSIPKCDSAKYICIVRNIYDCCLSAFDFLSKNMALFGGDTYLSLDRHVDFFVEGILPFGDYFEICQSWYERKDDPNVLFLTYEERRNDVEGGIMKIAKFLGSNYYEQICSAPELLEQIIRNTGLNSMQESKSHRNFPSKIFVEDLEKESKENKLESTVLNDANSLMPVDLIFKGEVGRGLKGLSEKHREILRGALEEKIKYPELKKILLNE